MLALHVFVQLQSVPRKVHLLEEIQVGSQVPFGSARFDELEAELQVPEDPQSHCMQVHCAEQQQ